MKRIGRVVGLVPAVVGLLAVAAPAAWADGVAIPGGTVGGQLFKSGSGNIFLRYLGAQARFTNDLHFYLTLGGSNQFVLRNTGPAGIETELTGSSGLATGAEVIFGVCTDLAGAPGTGCTSANNFRMGEAGRNADGQFHATLWTREAWIAGCQATPQHCDAAGLAALIADPSYLYVVGFEDSFNHSIDGDYNDLVFAVRGVSVVPEPMTMALLATGLAGLGGAGALRRRRAVGR